MKRISLMLLTYNRREVTIKSIKHNLRNAGYPIAEIVWVDNNSTDGLREMILNEIKPDISILHKENLGVAKGYNAGYKLCRGKLIARPGTDMIMPDNWLNTMVKYHNAIPETGICAVTSAEINKVSSNRQEKNGKTIYPETVIGSILFNRNILDQVGYLPENFGKYGWDDIVWVKQADNAGFLNYYIDELTSIHLGKDDHIEYQKQKIAEVEKNKDLFIKTMKELKNGQVSKEVSGPPIQEKEND